MFIPDVRIGHKWTVLKKQQASLIKTAIRSGNLNFYYVLQAGSPSLFSLMFLLYSVLTYVVRVLWVTYTYPTSSFKRKKEKNSRRVSDTLPFLFFNCRADVQWKSKWMVLCEVEQEGTLGTKSEMTLSGTCKVRERNFARAAGTVRR